MCILFGYLTACASQAPPAQTPPTKSDAASHDTALVGGTIIPAPDAAPIADGVLVLHGGLITAVGSRAATPIPAGARVVHCEGTTIVAGFWNSHVHFTEPWFENAASTSAHELGESLDEMLLRWGFVHVVDTGSMPQNTAALRRRIDAGEIAGPSILQMEGSFVAVGGQPKYVPTPLPQLADPEGARRAVTAVLNGGADGIKLMTVSVVAHPPAPIMPLAIVQAVTETAHARGAYVMAHPTNIDGVRVAVDGGVDVLAHTAPESGPWSAEDIARMRRAKIALTPTLKLWDYEVHARDVYARFEQNAVQQVHDFAAAGGELLFGTDVGYMHDHDPTEEYALLTKALLTFSQILTMLTTAPAERWTKHHRQGTLREGESGDIVVLDGDPRRDGSAWSKVRYALRDGRVVHGAPPP
jgi:imidazolonepropionase-like amidohydrolase